MTGVRACRREDLPAVAASWIRVFRRPGSPAAVERYFAEVFFDHPQRDAFATSLVYEDRGGNIVGFIGALPRRLTHDGRPIRAVVASQLLVEPGPGRAFAAFELVQRLFSGPQDLTYSDGANESSLPIWERSGGEVARLYSLDWTRVLRPAGFARRRVDHRFAAARSGAAALAAAAADALASRAPLGPLRKPRAELADEELDEAAALPLAAESKGISAAYDVETFAWMLRKAAETRAHGGLRRRLCRDARGEPAGFYVYYAKPGDVGRVLQLAGRPGAMRGVLSNLFADAWREGSVAVSGQVQPRYLRELSDGHATISCPCLGVLVHSRRPDILAAIHRGDWALTRLDGEWWLRFAADPLPG